MTTAGRIAFISILFMTTIGAAGQGNEKPADCSPVGTLKIRVLLKVYDDTGETVYMRGTWGASQGKLTPSISPINTVEIECDKGRRICRETLAVLENTVRGEALLMALGEDYEIFEWSGTTVRAMRKTRAADIELHISIEHKTAERIARETAARGAQGASPVPERWSLH